MDIAQFAQYKFGCAHKKAQNESSFWSPYKI